MRVTAMMMPRREREGEEDRQVLLDVGHGRGAEAESGSDEHQPPVGMYARGEGPERQDRAVDEAGVGIGQPAGVDEDVDEPMTRQEASLFFRLVSYRYGRGAMLITSCSPGTRSWPPPSSTACSTARTSSTSRVAATVCATSKTR